ncbi:hypothetical protein ACI65C_005663 [Semiaphis heraclei]
MAAILEQNYQTLGTMNKNSWMFNLLETVSLLVEIIDNGFETNFRSNDIGLFANRTLTDADKKIVLRNLWVPNVNYEFPLLEKYKARGLKFQHKWFAELNWLAYSEIKQGIFCKYCLLFAKHGGVGSQPLGQLVSINELALKPRRVDLLL